MKKEDFASIMKTMGIVFGKEITEELLMIYYEVFKDEEVTSFKNAAKKILKTNKYFPTIAELVKECEVQKTENKYTILDFMKSKGYFKESGYPISEYEKARNWIETGVVPKWFEKDMEKFKKQIDLLEVKDKRLLISE